MILLDSSVLIDLFRKKDKTKSYFFNLLSEENDFAISTVTQYEIGIGNKVSTSDFWNELNDRLTILSFDQSCSIEAIEIYATLKRKNKLIDLADLLIGATAKSHNIPLATLNKKHFQRIDGLVLI
ncbi:type II toxin-antitoxin system VapC family toxin [Cecembia lonarensis]|uniref:PIN domain protein n=1 Tax=Cecembia lonarensis (strain CCUG 58316 / KCTC 22772 / LW9) TaxID=1225176 RepID=K1L3F7_CECL9|nr:type II toxin-antitoxin system VapC family toxin [Cecembia lonarensis]EKB50975.1 PIN domain protein [Cecembia lonarensis LW9]